MVTTWMLLKPKITPRGPDRNAGGKLKNNSGPWNDKTVHSVTTQIWHSAVDSWNMLSCVSRYPASKWVLLHSLNAHWHRYTIFSTHNNEPIGWTAHVVQMCHSYIHHSYLQRDLRLSCFFLICFRYTVCLKATRQKHKFLSIKIYLFEKVKGRVRKLSTELEEKDSI